MACGIRTREDRHAENRRLAMTPVQNGSDHHKIREGVGRESTLDRKMDTCRSFSP